MLLSAGMEANGGSSALTYAMFHCLSHPCGKILRLLLAVVGEEGKGRWANITYPLGPILHTASSLGNVTALSVLLAAGADATAVDIKGRLALDAAGEFVVEVGRSRNPAQDAACRRVLERAPAFRALSWSFPAGASLDGDDAVASRQHEGRLGVRIFRPRKRTFLIRHVGSRERSTVCLEL